MINGNEYAFEDINIIIDGKATPINGLVDINYEYTKEHVNIKGRGSKTVGLGRGMEDCKGDITILQSELEGLMATITKGQNLTHKSPFTITIAYAPPGGVPVVDQMLFCRIKNMPKGMKTGDTHMEIKLDLAVGDIQYNV